MNVTTNSTLISDSTNGKLCYKDSIPLEKNENIVRSKVNNAFKIVISLLAWPIFILMGSFTLLIGLYSFFKAIFNQRKIINILTNDNSLKKYAGKRIKDCEGYIKDLQEKAIRAIKRLERPDELDLSILQKWGVLSKVSQEAWSDFPWEPFLNINFIEKANTRNNPDERDLRLLETIRRQYKYIKHQQNFLSNSEINLEDIKRIAELSFVKNTFYKQHAKESVVESICMLMPVIGPFLIFDFNFKAQCNARSAYEGKKDLLPLLSNFEQYTDLVDAHNQLIEKNDFLVPLITTPTNH